MPPSVLSTILEKVRCTIGQLLHENIGLVEYVLTNIYIFSSGSHFPTEWWRGWLKYFLRSSCTVNSVVANDLATLEGRAPAARRQTFLNGICQINNTWRCNVQWVIKISDMFMLCRNHPTRNGLTPKSEIGKLCANGANTIKFFALVLYVSMTLVTILLTMTINVSPSSMRKVSKHLKGCRPEQVTKLQKYIYLS